MVHTYHLAWNANKDIERSTTENIDDARAMARVMSKSTIASSSVIIAVVDELINVNELYYNGVQFLPQGE